MFSLYSRFLDKFPILTKCVTSGVLFSLGDVVTQKCIIYLIKILKNEVHLIGKET